MTTLRNNFDGGPDGTNLTLANSGQVPGNNAFNVMSIIGSGTVIKYADAVALGRGTAEFVLKTSTAASVNDNALIWSTAMGTQTQIWGRQYIYLTALPPTDMTIFECDNGAVYTGSIAHDSAGELWIADNDVGTVRQTTTNDAPLNQWIRLEWRFKFSTTVGEYELRLYDEADSDEPLETLSATGLNLHAANANSFAFASAFPAANKPTTYYSGLELNNTGWPGPAPFKAHGVPGILTNPTAVHSDTR